MLQQKFQSISFRAFLILFLVTGFAMAQVVPQGSDVQNVAGLPDAISGKINVNGLDMYYKIVGEGTPVVFIAGLASDHLEWMPYHVPTFLAAGFRCVLFDNRDVGQTDESPIPSYTIRQMANDAAGLLKKLGIKQAHILGESMGGMISQELALNDPDLVKTLTLINTSPIAEPYLKAIGESWKNIRRKFPLVESFQSFGVWLLSPQFYENPQNEPMFLEEVRAHPHPQSVAEFERQWNAILTQNTLDRLHQIKVPTHIITGDFDILLPPRLSRMIAAKIPGSKLKVFPNGAHILAFEYPAEFNQTAIEFLKEQ